MPSPPQPVSTRCSDGILTGPPEVLGFYALGIVPIYFNLLGIFQH